MFRNHAADAALFAGLALLLALFAANALGVSHVHFERTAVRIEVTQVVAGVSRRQQHGVVLMPGDSGRDVVAGLHLKRG